MILRVVAALAAALLLSSCASLVRSHIYLPQPMPGSVSWDGPAPIDVTAETDDGLRVRGYWWPPPFPAGDVIVFYNGQSGNRHAAARAVGPLAAQGGLLVASYRAHPDPARH